MTYFDSCTYGVVPEHFRQVGFYRLYTILLPQATNIVVWFWRREGNLPIPISPGIASCQATDDRA